METILRNTLDSDRWLLQFRLYNDYLESLITQTDFIYLQSSENARIIAGLGYRSTGETLSKEQFLKRRAAVNDFVNPKIKPHTMFSTKLRIDDPLVRELADRERANRSRLLATIIFIRNMTKGGLEISGYIDYADRLTTDDWTGFFAGKKKLWPRFTDLSYYNWKSSQVYSNNSKNFKIVIDTAIGLQFQNLSDRLLIIADPEQDPGINSFRNEIKSEQYKKFVIYDHVVRRAD